LTPTVPWKIRGFGDVFKGWGEQQNVVAVKQLKITANEAAHRELRIVDELLQRPLAHIIPMLDDGQDAESGLYYIVMACAERSLQDEINRVGPLPETDAVRILRDIVTGLAEVQDIAHRDLKPANVLFHEGRWKLADFGIARLLRSQRHWRRSRVSSPHHTLRPNSGVRNVLQKLQISMLLAVSRMHCLLVLHHFPAPIIRISILI